MDDSRIVGWLIGTVVCVGSAFVGMVIWAFKKMDSRVDEIEDQMVTREEFKETWAALREDRRLMHSENREALRRIEEKIDESEGKNSNHRHSMNNEIQKLVAGTAVVESKVEDLRRAASK